MAFSCGCGLSGGLICAAAAPVRQVERTKASAILRIDANSPKDKAESAGLAGNFGDATWYKPPFVGCNWHFVEGHFVVSNYSHRGVSGGFHDQ
jgi:hypothetical protein